MQHPKHCLLLEIAIHEDTTILYAKDSGSFYLQSGEVCCRFKEISYLVVLLLCQQIVHLILFVEQVFKKLRFMGFGQIKNIHSPLRSPLPLHLLFTSLPLLQTIVLHI